MFYPFFHRKNRLTDQFLILDFDGDSLELLPSGAVGQANHEMIVARRGVGRDLQVLTSLETLQTARNRVGKGFVPRSSFVVVVVIAIVMAASVVVVVTFVAVVVVAIGTVAVVVEIAVDFDGVVAQFLIVAENVVEGNDFATLIDLTIDRIGRDSLVGNDGLRHVAVVVIAAASRKTKCYSTD